MCNESCLGDIWLTSNKVTCSVLCFERNIYFQCGLPQSLSNFRPDIVRSGSNLPQDASFTLAVCAAVEQTAFSLKGFRDAIDEQDWRTRTCNIFGSSMDRQRWCLIRKMPYFERPTTLLHESRFVSWTTCSRIRANTKARQSHSASVFVRYMFHYSHATKLPVQEDSLQSSL